MTTLLNLDPAQVPDDGNSLVYNAASKKWLPGAPSAVFADLSESATWQENRDALQAANDKAAAAGGGVVFIPPGRFDVKGVIQDSRVTITGPGATLVDPDGTGPDIIRARTTVTTGNATASSAALDVASVAGIEVGTVVGVQAAGGLLDTQTATLTSAITDTQTTGITLSSATGFFSSGVLMVGTEAIRYTGLSSATLTGVTRGHLGTTAAAHDSGAHIGLARRHITEVLAIVGTSLTLKDPPPYTVTGAEVTGGIIAPSIRDLAFDQNRIPGGSSSEQYPIRWDTVRGGTISDLRVVNAEAAVMIRAGSTDCLVERVHAHDCSVPEIKKGSAFWLYQSNRRNTLRDLRVSGDAWVGIYLDDRTTTAHEWDGPNEDNLIDGFAIDIPQYLYNPGVIVTGSNRNIIRNGTIRGPYTGLSLDRGSQYLIPAGGLPSARLNEIASVRFIDVGVPWVAAAPGNVLHDLIFSGVLGPPTNTGANYTYAVTVADGQAPVGTLPQLPNGTQSAPALTFANDTNSGMFLMADNMIGFSANAERVFRIQPGEIYMEDGKDIAVQSTTGTKIGKTVTSKLAFWGNTPIVQPTGTPAAATDETTAIALVNDLRAKLIALGLIA